LIGSSHEFWLAPLRGITDRIFRAAYERRFGRFDRVLAPFVPTILGDRVRGYHIKDILPNGGGVDVGRLTPQIIGNDPGGFLLLSRRFAELGFGSVNWNLGCPMPNITRKKRGSGLLPHRDAIEKFLDGVVPSLPIPLSIKARLGLDSKDELEGLIPLFNGYPLKELIIHPRAGSQLYGGTVDLDKFEICLRKSRHPVIYNGDIRAVNDYRRLSARFPDVNGWMVGRGVVMNPRLLNELRGGARGSVRGFLDDLLDANLNHFHPLKALGKMKEVWGLLGQSIDASGELSDRIAHCESIGEYRKVVDAHMPL